MKIVFVIKFPAFWCFAFQESPQSDFPRDNEGGECEKRVERNYMEKVFRVETTKLSEDFFSLLRTSEGSGRENGKRVDKVVAILIVFIHIWILMRAHQAQFHSGTRSH